MKNFNFSSLEKAVKANRHLIFVLSEPRNFFCVLCIFLLFLRSAIKCVLNIAAWAISVLLFGCMVVIDFLSECLEAYTKK